MIDPIESDREIEEYGIFAGEEIPKGHFISSILGEISTWDTILSERGYEELTDEVSPLTGLPSDNSFGGNNALEPSNTNINRSRRRSSNTDFPRIISLPFVFPHPGETLWTKHRMVVDCRFLGRNDGRFVRFSCSEKQSNAVIRTISVIGLTDDEEINTLRKTHTTLDHSDERVERIAKRVLLGIFSTKKIDMNDEIIVSLKSMYGESGMLVDHLLDIDHSNSNSSVSAIPMFGFPCICGGKSSCLINKNLRKRKGVMSNMVRSTGFDLIRVLIENSSIVLGGFLNSLHGGMKRRKGMYRVDGSFVRRFEPSEAAVALAAVRAKEEEGSGESGDENVDESNKRKGKRGAGVEKKGGKKRSGGKIVWTDSETSDGDSESGDESDGELFILSYLYFISTNHYL